jgi:hypothetical protein
MYKERPLINGGSPPETCSNATSCRKRLSEAVLLQAFDTQGVSSFVNDIFIT